MKSTGPLRWQEYSDARVLGSHDHAIAVVMTALTESGAVCGRSVGPGAWSAVADLGLGRAPQSLLQAWPVVHFAVRMFMVDAEKMLSVERGQMPAAETRQVSATLESYSFSCR